MASHSHPVKPLLIFAITLVVLTPSVSSRRYGNLGYVFRNKEFFSREDYLKNGPYKFELERDCRLVLTDPEPERESPIVWESREKGYYEGCTCLFDIYGILRVRSAHVPWESTVETALVGDYVLVLQEDRDVVVYGPSLWEHRRKAPFPGRELPVSSGDKYVLYSSGKMAKSLHSGEQLKNGMYVLKMQDDCNLVLYFNERSIWSTNTAGRGTNCYFKMAMNSNLEVHDGNKNLIWSTHNTGSRSVYLDEYVFVLHSNGDMVVYDTPIWRTDTYTPYFPGNHLNITTEAFAESSVIASVV